MSEMKRLALEMISIGYRNMVLKYGETMQFRDTLYGDMITLSDLREHLREEVVQRFKERARLRA